MKTGTGPIVVHWTELHRSVNRFGSDSTSRVNSPKDRNVILSSARVVIVPRAERKVGKRGWSGMYERDFGLRAIRPISSGADVVCGYHVSDSEMCCTYNSSRFGSFHAKTTGNRDRVLAVVCRE